MRSAWVPLALMAALVVGDAREASAAGALESVATEIVRGLGPVPPGTLVVASPMTIDGASTPATATGAPSNKADELSVRVAALLAGKLGGTSRAHGQGAPLGTARAVSGASGGLLYVAVEIAKGELRATADVYPVMSNGWDRIRVPVPPPRAHAFASAPIDAEVRAFLPPILLEQATIHKAHHDEGEVLAVGCGDIDGDGGMEIVVVSRTRVALGGFRQGKFAPRKIAAWSALSARVPVPLREPLAGVAFQPRAFGGGLYVGTTERGGVALDESLVVRSALRGIPTTTSTGDACVRPNPAESAFEGDVASCSLVVRDQVVRAASPTPRYDAIATAEVAMKSGKSRRIVAARELTGKLRIKLGDDIHVLEGAGAQLAVGDLDLDGEPEIVTSLDGADDAVQIHSVGAGEPRLRRKIPAPAGVRALAVCPPEERGVPALVAVVGPEIWLVR
ncbi:MAG: hypothetical protein JWM74_528 [Myxococcaceae bacterium]|nr:hypothetical protein [Myxococcaceae bacterium]